ncbi:hypothetical protein Tco_0977739 [Tanacetum coccineum]|uniref:Uncharacterized protein n=1 Tax=Tanacetum coccineum TaxID=301880 RepID=A0ABQ5EM13_9ASTR
MDPLEIQLDKEEFHEYDSKTCLAWLKKLFETSLYQKPAYYIRVQDFEDKVRRFQKYTGYSTQDFKDKIICYLNDIEKGIDARALHEESLWIKEKVVKERMESERRVIEFEMMRLDKMIQKGECSSSGKDTDAKRAKQSKKKCLIHFRLLHTLLEDFSKEDLTNACFSSRFHRAFSSLFGKDVEYFASRLFFNVDKLEKQLNTEEFNEEIAMVVFKNILISLMDSIEKANAERGLYKRAHDNKVHERMMQMHEGMISKDAPHIDNNVAGSFHDKDNITEVQSSNNEMFENILKKTKNAPEMFEKTKTDHKMLTEENVLLKKEIEAYKEKDKYVNNIIQLEAKDKDLENIVCKMGKSSQTLRMLSNEQSLYQENKRKMGLGYTNPCPLGQAIASHPKLYDAEVLSYQCAKPNVHDTEEILNDAEESQVKIKKQFQFNYENINNIYDTFVPQTELSPEQEYFSDPSFSSESESSKEMSDLPTPEMPKEKDSKIRWISNSQNTLRQFYKTDVILMSLSLMKSSKELQQELIEEVHEMLNVFESMERKVNRTSKKIEILQNKIDQLLEANIGNDVRYLVMQSYVEIKNKEEIERFSKESKDGDKFCNDVVEVKEKLSKQTVQLEADFAKLEAQSIAFEIALQHKTQENKSLKTLQKENENFMASLQIENAHLKQTYKDLFESVQSSRVETIQSDEVKIKFDFDKIETQNIELEHQVDSLLNDNEHLKLTYQNLFDSIKKSWV